GPKVADEYPRKHGALLIQLRTGHIPLNKNLHKISRAPVPPAKRERNKYTTSYYHARHTHDKEQC
ncbi:hypothetical protein BDR04DRAFT_1017025, partial [Suillus decipiens]